LIGELRKTLKIIHSFFTVESINVSRKDQSLFLLPNLLVSFFFYPFLLKGHGFKIKLNEEQRLQQYQSTKLGTMISTIIKQEPSQIKAHMRKKKKKIYIYIYIPLFRISIQQAIFHLDNHYA
jgi:hypothetical protein